jgi:hypothetical protein
MRSEKRNRECGGNAREGAAARGAPRRAEIAAFNIQVAVAVHARNVQRGEVMRRL